MMNHAKNIFHICAFENKTLRNSVSMYHCSEFIDRVTVTPGIL